MPLHLVFTKPLQGGDLLQFCRLRKLKLKEVKHPLEGMYTRRGRARVRSRFLGLPAQPRLQCICGQLSSLPTRLLSFEIGGMGNLAPLPPR